MSRKLVVMRRLTALLEGITTYAWTDENGDAQVENYDLVGKEFRGRKIAGADEVAGGQVLSILEAQRSAVGDPAGPEGFVRREDWTLQVSGWLDDDKVNPSDPAYLLAGAVEQQLGRVIATNPVNQTTGMGGTPMYPTDYMLGGTIAALTLAGSIVQPAQADLSRFAFFYIPIIVSFVKRT